MRERKPRGGARFRGLRPLVSGSAQASAVEAACRAPETDVWVAVVDDCPVGFVAVCLIDEGATRTGEISMVAVDPAQQRTGIGTSLVQRALGEIKAPGR